MGAFVVGSAAEAVIIRAVRGNPSELGWISDAVLSVGVAAMAFLWLHLRASRARVLELERDQIALDEQLRLAAEIQRNLLPDVPASTPGFRWAARMEPAERIGGDFYDFVEPAPGDALVILGDVSGKGVPAALVQSSLKALFRMIVRDTTDPAAIAEQMAAGLHQLTGGMPDQLARDDRSATTACRAPAEICEHLLRLAAKGSGPVGVEGWQDDRTALVFQVEAGSPRGRPRPHAGGGLTATPSPSE